jgi:chemotaxis protein methyltransferase CheR
MPVSTEQFHYVRQLVLERSAIVLSDDKTYLVESRLASLARSLGLEDATGVVTHLRTSRDRNLEQQVVEAMTTNETSWFRDQRPFAALRQHVIPKLVEANARSRRLAIWSAASSSGQELYSVAMLLEDEFPQLRLGWQVDLLGSDLNAEMVRRATTGLFSTLEVNRGLPASMLVRCFTQEGANWRINDTIRSRTRFFQMNLAEPWPALPSFDVVLLRNVLIYFDVSTKAQILRRVRSQMAVGSYLLLGAAESPTGLCDDFETVTAEGSVFYRAINATNPPGASAQGLNGRSGAQARPQQCESRLRL